MTPLIWTLNKDHRRQPASCTGEPDGYFIHIRREGILRHYDIYAHRAWIGRTADLAEAKALAEQHAAEQR